jgi:hypothetical protein
VEIGGQPVHPGDLLTVLRRTYLGYTGTFKGQLADGRLVVNNISGRSISLLGWTDVERRESLVRDLLLRTLDDGAGTACIQAPQRHGESYGRADRCSRST